MAKGKGFGGFGGGMAKMRAVCGAVRGAAAGVFKKKK